MDPSNDRRDEEAPIVDEEAPDHMEEEEVPVVEKAPAQPEESPVPASAPVNDGANFDGLNPNNDNRTAGESGGVPVSIAVRSVDVEEVPSDIEDGLPEGRTIQNEAEAALPPPAAADTTTHNEVTNNDEESPEDALSPLDVAALPAVFHRRNSGVSYRRNSGASHRRPSNSSIIRRASNSSSIPHEKRTRQNSLLTMLRPVVAEPCGSSDQLFLGSEYDDIPIFNLTSDQELVNSSEVEITPATTLERGDSIGNRVRNMDVEATLVRQASDITAFDLADGEEDGPMAGQVRTALFISARVLKSTDDDNIGFKIKASKNNTLVISEVRQDGLLSQSPVFDGDTLISINNDSCYGMRISGAQKLIRNTKDYITITVQTSQGDGSLVECYVMKPKDKDKIGLDIVDEPFHRRARLRSASTGPLIRSIRTDGLMIDSLLNPGDQIVSINGQAVSSARSAKNTLAEAKTHITILAKTKERTVAVVTTTPQMGTRSSIYDLYGTPVQARRLHEAQQSRSSTYDTARMTCNIAALILSIVTLFFPSDVGLFITDINWLFALISIFTLVKIISQPSQVSATL